MLWDPINSQDNILHLTDGFNDEILPICPPSRYHPQDLEQAMGASPETLQHLQKYYVSQILEIEPNIQPPFEVITHADQGIEALSPVDKVIFDDFTQKIVHLMLTKDICDQVGIKYLGQFAHYYCPNKAAYQQLHGITLKFLQAFFAQDTDIVDLAKKWARCEPVISKR